VHRDIKPGNIILAKLEEARPTRLPSIPRDVALRFGRPVLLDFGSAREADASGKTMTGILTPSFGAPEQSRDRGRQDGRTDLYGLASTLYYALAGERIPAATDREAQDLLVPAAQRFAKHAPPSFLRAIDRALQLRPEYRPRDIRAFRGELFGDFQIEGWSKPASEFDPPGPGIYANNHAAFAQVKPKPPGVAFSSRYFTVAGVLVALAITILLAARGLWAHPSDRPPGPVQTPISAKAPTPFAVAKSIDIAMRQMQASQSLFNEISTLRASRNEFARTPGLEDSLHGADRRIGELEQSAKSDKQDAFEMFRALVESAIQDPAGFTAAVKSLEDKARADGHADDLRKLEQIDQLVVKSVKSGSVTKQDVDGIWNRQVEVLR
jgi:serine/threonine protein kinase